MKILSHSAIRPAFAAGAFLSLTVLPGLAAELITGGTYIGQNGVNTIAQGASGSAAIILTNQDLGITGGSFTGGAGGYGSAFTFDPGEGPIFIPGYGGNGGTALGLQGGTIHISGGSFTSGAAGGGDTSPGLAGSAVQIYGGATVLIDGGNFTLGAGASALSLFDISDNSQVTFDGDFGAANGQVLTGSGTLIGKFANNPGIETYTYNVAPGSTLTVVPEPSAALLACLPAFALLRRRRSI